MRDIRSISQESCGGQNGSGSSKAHGHDSDLLEHLSPAGLHIAF